ncbi:hypothetical protein ACH4E7_21630 [Kitasatospora sp. NPDC018058]|uniref:hypothetical protein n=1 Tax=Kitasatospora sp. NPDC018058 TaxID=3364025 RepID=UPI0037BED856
MSDARMVMTWVNASIAPLETATGADGEPTAVNGTTVPTSRSSSRSVTLATVPRSTTANALEEEFKARYAMFALSGLSASHCSLQLFPVSSEDSANCCWTPRKARSCCSASVSPDGRGVAAVAVIAASVMATWGIVGVLCSAGMRTPWERIASPDGEIVFHLGPAGDVR